MTSWSEVERQARELAARAHDLFELRVHKLIATLRADGSPRISGCEAHFAEGDVWLGMMPGSLKALDLRRDPRVALHSGSADPPDWSGDAKAFGLAIEESPKDALHVRELIGAGGGAHLFRLDIRELAVVRLGEPADHLIIETWHHERGLSAPRRR